MLEGRIDSVSHQVESPIGRLVIRGRSVDDSTRKAAAKDSSAECATDADKMFIVAYVFLFIAEFCLVYVSCWKEFWRLTKIALGVHK